MNHHNPNSNSNPIRGNFGFGNAGGMQMQMAMNHNHQQVPHQSQPQQAPGRPYFPGHFQLSEPQSQGFGQAQSMKAQAPVQILAPHQGHSNITISSPSMSTPGSAVAGTGGKRLQKPPSRLSGGSSGQGTASPMKTMELAPTARRGKRKLPDKLIPDKVAAILPECALYTQLLEFESRVDAALVRKKVDIIESLKNPMRVQKVLRIYVFNTYANQTGTNAEPPSWSLRLTGRILEDGQDPVAEGLMKESKSSYPKLSSFIKKITIYLDQSLYPDNHVILWESSRSPVLHEGFEVKRKGDKEFTAIIRLEMNYMPEKFRLSPALQEVLGIDVDTRPRIMAALWQYVKIRKLQIPGETSSFMCDPPLRRVFGEDKLKFSMVAQKITSHLIPPGPIHFEHRVKLSGANPAGNTCYDLLVDVPILLEDQSAFLANLEKNQVIDACDEAISSAIKKIHEHYRRRAFFLGFSQSPAEFINALIASQARDLKVAASDTGRDVEKERRAEFYDQLWVEDAVIRYINRKTAVGSEAAGNWGSRSLYGGLNNQMRADPPLPLQLYEFEACPFCRRVRETITELDLTVEIFPCPKGSVRHRAMVRRLGGRDQFPFLVDPNTGTSMYESSDIVKYLFQQYGGKRSPSFGIVESTLLTGWMPTLLRAGRGLTLWENSIKEPPSLKLELFSYENNPYARIVREVLCELELPYILQSVGQGSIREKLLFEMSGSKEVPYLVDHNTGVEIRGYKKIMSYLCETYSSKTVPGYLQQ